MSDKETIAYCKSAILDRERRMVNLISIIRRLVKDGAVIPRDTTVDYTLTPEQARVFGIQDWQGAMQPQLASG